MAWLPVEYSDVSVLAREGEFCVIEHLAVDPEEEFEA
jgi:hypothetical protein